MCRGGETGKWCILRAAGPSTLRLTASLQDAGIAAWTPTEHLRRRVPRGKMVEHLIVPLAPTYVFVRGIHLPTLQAIERADVTQHPRFSIFRHCGASVFVSHRALHPLRSLQQSSYLAILPNTGRAPSKRHGAHFDVGDKVTLTQGAFTGFMGFVETSDGLETKVIVTLFGRDTGVTVPTLQLRSRYVSAA